jgi:hypothetical protein
VIKLRRMRWAGHVELMGEMKKGKNIGWNPGKEETNLNT